MVRMWVLLFPPSILQEGWQISLRVIYKRLPARSFICIASVWTQHSNSTTPQQWPFTQTCCIFSLLSGEKESGWSQLSLGNHRKLLPPLKGHKGQEEQGHLSKLYITTKLETFVCTEPKQIKRGKSVLYYIKCTGVLITVGLGLGF